MGSARRDLRQSLRITCPSLKMWRDYFRKREFTGLDIDNFTTIDLPHTKILRTDQGKAEELLRVVAQCPRFDIIIDDGSHASYHQQLTLKILFPHLTSNGLYIIEDILSQPEDLEASLPAVWKTRDLLKNSAKLKQTIVGAREVLFLDSLIQKHKEALAVIVKD
jgi:hypothetical protein